jgi:uncharacterized membrane protein
MTVLAYIILALFYLFCIIPVIGDFISISSFNTYKDAFKIGISFHLFVVIFCAVPLSILWAINVVF